MNERVYVFVVCGADEHIHTLNYSLKTLKKVSTLAVIVVTDLTRNGAAIDHDSVVHVNTPPHFNHHQASIYLKTGLHKFLPGGPLYCYLDTDIVALNETADEVFDEWVAPITFGPDHCRMEEFSPYAVNCNCLANHQKEVAHLKELENHFDENHEKEYRTVLNEIDAITARNKRNFFTHAYHIAKYMLSGTYYHPGGAYNLEKKSQRWRNQQGEYLDEIYTRNYFFKKHMGITWNDSMKTFVRANGKDFMLVECRHLHELIERDFKEKVVPVNFQHWNGGMFLFNVDSSPFLEYWHQACNRIFNIPDWKTRDQGTLIATAGYFKLLQQPLINTRFNFIVDYNAGYVKYNSNLSFTCPQRGTVAPAFAHVFHHFGDKTWKVWQDIEKQVQISYAG